MAESEAPSRGRIFISYRRQETAAYSGWLFDRLVVRYPGEVFKDVDSIELGDDFVEVITAAVGSCDVLLALIGDRWVTIADDDGRRRLDDPDDFVRVEIEAALTRKVRVIPILVDGARMPRAEELPPSLARLVRRNALELSPARFDYDTNRLLKVLDRTLTEVRAARGVSAQPRPPVAPAGLGGSSVEGRVDLWWDPPVAGSAAVVAWQVFRDGTRVGEVTEPRASDQPPGPGSFGYTVTAVGVDGQRSAPSERSVVVVPSRPVAPAGLGGSSVEGRVDLRWDPPVAGSEDSTATHSGSWRWLVIAAASVMILMLAGGAVWALVTRKTQDQITASDATSPPVTQATWVRQADLPVALEGAAVAAYQDKMWVAGGLSNDAARTKLSTVFIFDPRTNTWTSGPALPQPISHGSLVPTPWTLYFIAGWVQDGGSAQVLKLNATNTAWVEDVPLPEKRVAGAAAYDGSTIIYAGGTQKGGAPTDTVWALRGGRWQDIGRLRHRRQKLAAVSNNVDTVWVLGGRNHLTDTKYGDMDRIAQGRVMPLPASRTAPISPPVDSAAAVQLDGYGVCLVGGEIGGRRYNDWWCEQPAANLPKLSPQRAGLGVAKIGDTIYVVGGYGATFQGTNRVEALTLPRP
jgi:hypothetical protein